MLITYPFKKSLASLFRLWAVSSQTGTIRPCICCIWDSIPCRLLRILFWCAAEEMPMRAISLRMGGEKREER